jgi:hypothetical protein
MRIHLLKGYHDVHHLRICIYIDISNIHGNTGKYIIRKTIKILLLVRHSTIDRIQKLCLVIGHKLAQFKGSYSLRTVDGLFLIVFLAIYFYSFSYYIFPGVTMDIRNIYINTYAMLVCDLLPGTISGFYLL